MRVAIGSLIEYGYCENEADKPIFDY